MKMIIFSGGPLDAQQMAIEDEDAKEYCYKQLISDVVTDKKYIKSKHKIGVCELFIYEENL